MPLLIVEHHGSRRTAPLVRRVLIGRRGGNHVVIDDRAVAMIHAWIDKRGDQCVLTDTGSRVGTYVNGKRITHPLPLCDGDLITVGPAVLTFQANGAPVAEEQDRSHAAGEVEQPEPAKPVEVESSGEGWLFDCACGAPLWAGSAFSGRTAYCRYCGREVRVPASATVVTAQLPTTAVSESRLRKVDAPAATPPPPPPPQPADEIADSPPPPQMRMPEPPPAPVATAVEAISPKQSEPPPAAPKAAPPPAPPARAVQDNKPKATQTCGICQTGIALRERITTCPSCGLAFHTDCWVENRGCSAYGCPQVGALDARETEDAAADAGSTDADSAEIEKAALAYSVKPPFPWEYATLAASAFCLLISTLTFGIPSFIVGATTMVIISRKPGVRRKTGVLLLSTFLAFLGFIGGIGLSWFWYFGTGGRDGA